ncbi:MAG: hypothetical protein M3072_09235 [Candidatus Dormibacteraeota bacterium]|nr:hypothetical protein [Candidatus Dormibacteraeota bacterium]
MASTSACPLGQPAHLLGPDQVGNGAVEAPLGCRLDVTAVVEDLHACRLKLLAQAAQRKSHLRDRHTGRLAQLGQGRDPHGCQAGAERGHQLVRDLPRLQTPGLFGQRLGDAQRLTDPPPGAQRGTPLPGLDQGQHAHRDLGLRRHLLQAPAQRNTPPPQLLC